MGGVKEPWTRARGQAWKEDDMSLILVLPIYTLVTYINCMAETVMLHESVITKINDNGRIVVPVDIRKSMGLKAGDAVVMTLENGVLRIESHEAKIRKIQEDFRKFAKPGILASDELIADRREEARQDMEEWLG